MTTNKNTKIYFLQKKKKMIKNSWHQHFFHPKSAMLLNIELKNMNVVKCLKTETTLLLQCICMLNFDKKIAFFDNFLPLFGAT